MPTRKYDQRLRADSTAETRRRILDALRERLRTAPSESIGLEAIARAARVARPTIYAAFGSRSGLFDALGAELLQRGGFHDMLQAAAHADAREALRGSIRGVVTLYATDPDVLRALHAMARLDAGVGGSVRALEQRRADGMAHLARRLAAAGALRPDTTVAAASDLLWMLTSFEAVELLRTGRARTPAETADALITVAERTLCAQDPR